MKQTAVRFLIVAAAVGAVLLLPTARAAPIVGSVDVSGGDATVSLTTLSFQCNPTIALISGPCTIPPALPGPSPSLGNFVVTNSTGGFSSEIGGFIGAINNTIAPVNTLLTGSGGVPGPVANWVQFVTAPATPPNIALDLNFVAAGIDGPAGCTAVIPAAGQVCTPAFSALINPNNPLGLSPYNLQNISATQSSASFSVSGTARNIATGDTSPFIGTFSSQFNQPFQSLLSTIAAGGTLTGSIHNSFSATFTAVPEPRSVAALLAALFALGMVGLKRFKGNFSED